ncbi:hypothetical protein [Natronospira bacteriovora]|uniref:Uncharacterized protein n=1 Tax=Natronospira bacteriovora TaxID=3069753 RepID=A0ABU0W5Q3_9GAMM|nr:hypothetical protein [Natronospira sp. AB-CW4]MDQ2069269.1 hypothetical protein [Natronospira sp. AB-CW4]
MDSTPVITISALILVILVLLGIAVLLRRHRQQRPYSRVVDPDVRMADIWQTWMETELPEAQDKLRDEGWRVLDSNQRKSIRDDLLAFEEKLLAGPYPLTYLRQEMMASVDRRMINIEILRLSADEKKRLRQEQADIIQSDQHAREYILANELRLALLREYAARRYGDRADNDWLHVYERAAQFKKKATRARILRGLQSAGDSPEDARQQAIDVVDRQLQMRLLQVPPGTRFDEGRRASGQDAGHDTGNGTDRR